MENVAFFVIFGPFGDGFDEIFQFQGNLGGNFAIRGAFRIFSPLLVRQNNFSVIRTLALLGFPGL